MRILAAMWPRPPARQTSRATPSASTGAGSVLTRTTGTRAPNLTVMGCSTEYGSDWRSTPASLVPLWGSGTLRYKSALKAI